MSASLGLYRLQVVDSQMDKIRTRLDKIRQILENDEAIWVAQKRVSASEKDHNTTLQALKQAEAEVEKQKIKIEQSEANLYSGTVKNPKELQDLQNEAAALKRYLVTLEDRQLETMRKEETANANYQEALSELEHTKNRLADQNHNLTLEQIDLNNELERLGSERQAALHPLNPNLLSIYDELRHHKKGLAVAVVSEGACAACGTTLSPAQNQSARSNTDLYYCSTCKRILFAN